MSKRKNICPHSSYNRSVNSIVLDFEVMNLKEDKTVVEVPEKTYCLKPSDGECYSDDTVRPSNESLHQKEQEFQAYPLQDNLSQPVHEQTLSIGRTLQSKTEAVLIEQDDSSKIATGRKDSKREGQPLGMERKRNPVETEPKKVKREQRTQKSTGVTFPKTSCIPSTSSEPYVSTAYNNKAESVPKTTISIPTTASSSSMQRDRLEEGTSKKPQMPRSSNTLPKSSVSTSDKNKPYGAHLSDNLDDFDMDGDRDDDDADDVGSSEEDSELESILSRLTSYLHRKQNKGKKVHSKKYKKLAKRLKLLNVNSETCEMKLGRATKTSKLKHEKGQEMIMTENIMTDEDNNSSDPQMTTEKKKKKGDRNSDARSTINNGSQTSITQTDISMRGTIDTLPATPLVVADEDKKETKANVNTLKRPSVQAPQPLLQNK